MALFRAKQPPTGLPCDAGRGWALAFRACAQRPLKLGSRMPGRCGPGEVPAGRAARLVLVFRIQPAV